LARRDLKQIAASNTEGLCRVHKRKLIEVALPLEAINRESAHEKVPAIRRHPRTLHLWWARRPLVAARAILFAQLVDDPSARPEEFPTEEAQRAERERLHDLIERLVVWENTWDEKLLAEAHAEILKSTGGSPPAILDPFAGGGTIPLEAQRLGLEAHASDLNPVAVLINKALIEIPPKFANHPPTFPGLASARVTPWRGAEGLAADVRAYGQWMREEAEVRIGHLYPTAKLPGGGAATVVAWIWARTVICPNPACGIEMPLARSWWLGKKKGKEAYVIPLVVPDAGAPGGRRVTFGIGHGLDGAPTAATDGTMHGRTGALCVSCSTSVPTAYIRAQGIQGRIGSALMAVVAEGYRQRLYLPPTPEQVATADVDPPDGVPTGDVATNPRWFSPPAYGLTKLGQLFTNRQLVALTTFSDLVAEARDRVLGDALTAGLPSGALADGGTGAEAYADAVATYLGLAVSRTTDRSSAIAGWDSSLSKIRNTFGRQAIPMSWDFAEASLFSSSTGNFQSQFDWIADAIEYGPSQAIGTAVQADASNRSYEGLLVSTDPPYYDNIGYSDLSDFFYVWLRRSLRNIHPELLSTMLVPKAEELVANPYRHDGKEGAEQFFEDGFRQVFANARASAMPDFPITVYYAFKQSEKDSTGEASTGWETLLEGMIRSGWEITSTWPLRSEQGYRMIASGTNALASSIVLSLRPRPSSAPTTDRRGFISALEAELPGALRKLQQGQIAPVDLPQSAIGPGMAVYSRYSGVLEPDGKKMTVRSALERINEILDQVLNEQEGDFDTTSRFAIAWYRQHGYSVGKFGDADNLARARNTSVNVLDRDGVLMSRAGNVQLVKPTDLSWDYDPVADSHTSNWEALHHLIKVLERDGITPAGDFLRAALSRPDGTVDADLVKELAHLLFRIAEGSGWTKDALSFNTLVTSWPEILEVARSERKAVGGAQGAFDFDEED
jgi:putative DNA methylase